MLRGENLDRLGLARWCARKESMHQSRSKRSMRATALAHVHRCWHACRAGPVSCGWSPASCWSAAPGSFAAISATSVPTVAAGSLCLDPDWHGALPTFCRLCHCLVSLRFHQRRGAGHATTAMVDLAAAPGSQTMRGVLPTDTFARHSRIAALCPSRSGGRVADRCGFTGTADPHVLNGADRQACLERPPLRG